MVKKRKCKFRQSKNDEWEQAMFHGFMECMNSDCEPHETFFQDTYAVVETKDGKLHNAAWHEWETLIEFIKAGE